MSEKQMQTTRFIAAVMTGMVVFGLASVSAWYEFSTSSYVNYHASPQTLNHVVELLGEHITQHGSLPPTLDDLPGDGVYTDSWNRPFHYKVNGNTFELISYGRDGVPGGVGYDADMTPQSLPEAHKPTYLQFLTDPLAHAMIATCLLGGLFAGAIVVWRPRRRRHRRNRKMQLVLPLLATLVVTILIAALHIPSGH